MSLQSSDDYLLLFLDGNEEFFVYDTWRKFSGVEKLSHYLSCGWLCFGMEWGLV